MLEINSSADVYKGVFARIVGVAHGRQPAAKFVAVPVVLGAQLLGGAHAVAQLHIDDREQYGSVFGHIHEKAPPVATSFLTCGFTVKHYTTPYLYFAISFVYVIILVT